MEKSDILIKNAEIVDGTGSPRFKSDVCVSDGKINIVGRSLDFDAKTVIDAAGLILSPGFIDMHGHSDLDIFFDPSMYNKLEQGITTEISGFCGLTLAPVSNTHFDSLKRYLGFDRVEEQGFKLPEAWPEFREFGRFIDEAEKLKTGTNIAFYVGQGTVRLAVMGYENRRATPDELERMKALVGNAMENGALGLSTGLIYAPGVFTSKEEIVELCKVVKKYGGHYATHMRSESDNVVSAVKEALDIGRQAGVPVAISRHKAAGKPNWGKSAETLKLIDDAIKEGQEVYLDQYPYKAGKTSLTITIPPEYHEGGIGKLLARIKEKAVQSEIREKILDSNASWENMVRNCGFGGILMSSATLPEVNGKTVEQYAQEKEMDEFEALFKALIESRCEASAAYFLMDDVDIERIMKYPHTMVGTDSGIGAEHPRGSGTFPRVLGRYVREKRLFSLEEAIKKMTSLPALKTGLKTKGLVKEGFDADLVLFNPNTIIDRADYYDPRRKNEGLEYVIVNGAIAVKNNAYLGTTTGKVLRI